MVRLVRCVDAVYLVRSYHHRLRYIGLHVENSTHIEEHVHQRRVGSGRRVLEKRNISNSSLNSFQTEGIFHADWKPMQWTDDFLLSFEIVIEVAGSFEGTIKEVLREAGCLETSASGTIM